MRGSKFPADMHNYIWCPIYIPSFMIIGSVVSEELRWFWDWRSDPTPSPAFAFGDAGNKMEDFYIYNIYTFSQEIYMLRKLTCLKDFLVKLHVIIHVNMYTLYTCYFVVIVSLY